MFAVEHLYYNRSILASFQCVVGMSNTPDILGARYAALVAGMLEHPEVAYEADAGRQRFGATSLKVHNKIFAMLVRGRLVVKLPRQRVEALVAAGAGERFDPGHGRPMREWIAVEPESGADWPALAHEALAFVAAGSPGSGADARAGRRQGRAAGDEQKDLPNKEES
jgi:hypothetical protein